MEYRNNFSTMIVFNKFRAEICKLLGFSEILTCLCREVFPGNPPSYTALVNCLIYEIISCFIFRSITELLTIRIFLFNAT